MIQLYPKGQTDYSRRGIEIHAAKASVTYQDNGRFDLDVDMPMPEGITVDYGMILRCTVPKQEVGAITLGTVSYWQVNAANVPLYGEVPTLRRIYYSPWRFSQASSTQAIYSVGDKCTYANQNYECVAYDASSPLVQVPPSSSSWWTEISNTVGKPGKTLATLNSGDMVFKTGDFNDTYMKASDMAGHEGFIQIAKCTDMSQTEERIIPAQTIEEQSFYITEIQKSTDGKQLSLHAEHVSYELGRIILGDCNLVRVNPATAVMLIKGAMKEPYGGEIYTNLTEETVSGDWSWKNAQNAILDPKAGLLQATSGHMIRNDLDVFLLKSEEPDPRYKVTYGTNMQAVDWDGSVADMVTRIYPTAQTEDGNTLLLPEEHIDTVRTVPFVRPEVLNTGLKVGTEEEQSDGTKIKLDQETVFARMREAAANRFNIDECDTAEITLEVDWIHLPDTEEYAPYAALRNAAPGEWVQVDNGPLGISEVIQLTGYTFDPILCRYEKCKFGKNKVKSTVASHDIKSGAVTGKALAAGAVGGQNIQANAITAREIEANSITADKIASRSIETQLLAAGCVTADEINAGAVTAEKVAANAITAQKIAAGAVETAHLDAYAVTAEKVAAGAITAEKIGAGAITAAKIDTDDLTAIQATLQIADIASATIESADIHYAQVKDLTAGSAYFGQAVIQAGLANKLYVPRLSVGYAQMIGATVGDLVVQASNGNFYAIDVDLNGNVTATQRSVSQEEITSGHTNDGRQLVMDTDILAENLTTNNLTASHALMYSITANIIDVDQLWAREAFVNKLMVQDISSNTYIQSVIGDWTGGSTITQTINTLSSRITQLGYGAIFYSDTEPSHENLQVGDIWIEPVEDNTWDDIGEFTWDHVGNLTWDQVAGQYRMYVWTGEEWKILYDNLIVDELTTEIRQTAYAVTLKADKSLVDTLSGEVSEFSAELDVQAEQIRSAVSSVNSKTANYTRLTDPADDSSISLNAGDTWTKASGDGTWNDAAEYTWDELAELTWDEVAGAGVYTWTGTRWVQTGDYGATLQNRTLIDQTSEQVTILAQKADTLDGELNIQRASLTVAYDRIAQEVLRATTAEGGKLDKTSSYQTADAIVSEAVRQAGVAGDGAYIKQTSSMQTADAIVNSAKSYTNTKLTDYSTTEQTAEAISAYVTNNAYKIQSGIDIAAAGVLISGSKYVRIESGSQFRVKSSGYGVDSTANDYVMWAGATAGGSAPFRVTPAGKVTMTSLAMLDKNGNETVINLRTAGLWKLSGNTVTAYTVAGGSVTSMTLSNGTTVNFKSAASFMLNGYWSGDKFHVDMTDNSGTTVYKTTDSGAITVNKTNAEIKAELEGSTHQSTISVDNDEGEGIRTIIVDARGVYTQGYQQSSQDGAPVGCTLGSAITATLYSATVTRRDGGTTSLQAVDCSKPYNAGVAAGEGKFAVHSGALYTVDSSGMPVRYTGTLYDKIR